MIRILGLLALLAGPALAAETVRTEAAHLRFSLPGTWTRLPASGETQAARYRLPAAPGDLADTELLLSSVGNAAGFTTDAELERWYGRFTQPDGSPAKGTAAVVRRRVDGLAVVRLDLGGTYVGSPTGAVRAGVSGYRMLGAVVEGAGGPWTFEVLGPKATVADARADFDALLFSLELHQ
jgi:hypothetical protein